MARPLLLALLCSACGTRTATSRWALDDRARLVAHFAASGYTDPERDLVSLTHVCTLKVGGDELPVVDQRELVPSDTSPRGVNVVVVLDEQWRRLNHLEYVASRPLMCREDRLYLWGDLQVPELGGSGNVLTFDRAGAVVRVQSVDAADLF